MASDGSQLTTMAELAGVAALVVAPYAWIQARRIRRDRRGRRAAAASVPVPESVLAPPDDLSRVIAEFDRVEPGSELRIPMPERPLVDGRAAPDDIARALIADAARRSGVEIVERTATELVCRRAVGSRRS